MLRAVYSIAVGSRDRECINEMAYGWAGVGLGIIERPSPNDERNAADIERHQWDWSAYIRA